jgi:hypothetical protein
LLVAAPRKDHEQELAATTAAYLLLSGIMAAVLVKLARPPH